MAKLTDEDVVAIVNQEFDDALGAPGGDISQLRASAYDYYLRKAFQDDNPNDGTSQVVTSDVMEIVDGIMPSLLRIFTTSDNVVSFDPVGPEDEEQAQQESDYVNHVFFKENNSFEILFFWMFDALVQIVGITKAWWDESEVVNVDTYQGLSEDEMLLLLDDDELELVEREEREAETLDDLTGQPVMATVHDIKVKRRSKVGRCRVGNVPPEEYRISGDVRSLSPVGVRLVGQEREAVTRSELRSMGFEKGLIDSLPSEESPVSAEELSRRDKSDELPQPRKHRDPSQDTFRLREGYALIDADDDGIAELQQAFVVGDKLLERSDFDEQPFHAICPHPLPHKHFGQSAAEKGMDIQEIRSELTRQILMNLYHSNNPGTAVWEQAIGENTLDDLLTTRVGSFKRFSRPVHESFAPITVPYTAGQSYPMLELWDKTKRDRTGVSADSQGLTPEALKNIQNSVLVAAMDMSRMKIEAIARIFAETGFKSLFIHIRSLLMKHQQKAKVVRLRGKWVKIDPRTWRTRLDTTVNIGLGIGTREQNLVHLENISQKQFALAQMPHGALLVKPKNMFATLREIVKNANLRNPGLFFSDPGEAMAPPPSDEQQKLAEMQAQLQARQQQLDAQDQQLKEQKLGLDRQQMMLEHQREVAEIQRKSEADKDKFSVENEHLRNELLELRLKYGNGAKKPEARP